MSSDGTNLPFGFGSGDGEPGGGDDLSGAMPLFAELQKLMSWSGGPVNWELARQLAASSLGGGQLAVSAAERAAVADALRLADLWLDEVTDLPSGVVSVESWTRLEWIEKTLPVWSALCDPVAARVVAAMSSAIPAEQLAELGAGNPLAGIMTQVGGLMFGAQVGQGLGGLAQEVVAGTDIGVPLGPSGVAALIPQNVADFGAGLERPADEVRLYLALREAAHQRLFGHVPWLRQRLLDTVEAYSRGISVDMSAIERAMSEIDPTNPESMQNALAGGLFAPEETPEQHTALRRLETLLALVEGWVDAVVALLVVGSFYAIVARRSGGATVGEVLLQTSYITGKRVPLRPRAALQAVRALVAGSDSEFSATCDLLRALSDPVRLKIAARLLEGSQTLPELAASSGVSPFEVRHLLGRLQTTGVVDVQDEDPDMRYDIRTDLRPALVQLLGAMHPTLTAAAAPGPGLGAPSENS